MPEAREAQQGSQAQQRQDAQQTRQPQQTQEAQQRDGAVVRQFIQRFGSLLADAGMPRMPARIFAALLTTDSSRLTAEELAGLLQVSPAAVSGGVRYLIQVGLASRETQPGSRRHVYVLPDNVWHEVLRVRDGIMMRWADAIRGGAEVLGAGTPAGAPGISRCLRKKSINCRRKRISDALNRIYVSFGGFEWHPR